MHRSYLYAPGHSERVVAKVFSCGADAVVLDLEDAVPLAEKAHARAVIAEVLASEVAFVRINAAGTELAAADLAALAGSCRDIKIPKVESVADVEWVARRAPEARLHCIIESARGVLAASEIAAAPSVASMSVGAIDLARDLRCGLDWGALQYSRSAVVVASSAAGIEPPADSAFGDIRDLEALRRESVSARTLGFFGKVAIHPSQVEVINSVFTPSDAERAWAEEILAAFERSAGGPTRTAGGEFVDVPVALRARALLDLVSPGNG